MTKKCAKCHTSSDVTNYYKRDAYCKSCRKVVNAKYQSEHKEQIQARVEEWRAINAGKEVQHPMGYVWVLGPHPIDDGQNRTLQHRLVLWEKLNGQDAICYWCFKPVYWKSTDWFSALVADHLNAIRDDNRPENIVPACAVCNMQRGRRKAA